MQLDGTLDKFPLRELIEMVVYSSVTGVLEMAVGDGIGRLFFRDGRPYHAVAGEQVGADAVAAMFEERDAPFRFVADRDTPESTLWVDPWELIERAEAQARKWAAIRAHIPTLDHVPALRTLQSANQIQISEAIWPVLAAVDGQRSVREIAGHLNWVLLDACDGLVDLIDRGLIEIQPQRLMPRAPRAVASPAAAGSAEGEGRSASGFLERLLAEAQAKEKQRPDLTDEQAQDRKRVYRYVDDRR